MYPTTYRMHLVRRQQLIGQATSVMVDFSRQLIISKINR